MEDNTKETLEIYWRHSRNYKVSGLFMVFSVIAASFVSVIIPLYFKTFFDQLTSGQAADMVVKGLIIILISIAGLEFTSWFFWRISGFASNYFESKVMTDLTNYCFAYLHRHSFGFFNDNFVGSLTKRVKWFSGAFENITDRIVWSILPLIVNIVVIVFVLFRRNYWLGLGILVWILIFMVVNWFFTQYKLKYDIERSEAETRTTGILADTVTNNSTVKLFNGYRREVNYFGAATEALRRLRKLTWDLGATFEAIQGFFMIGLEIGILFLAIKLWQRGILTIGDFVLIQSYLINIFNRVWDFGKMIRQIYERLADAEEMTEILKKPHEIQDVKGAKKLVVNKGKIEFREVVFNYNETRSILKNFNLIVQPRERLALIGPSGAGKTTAVKILLRMYDLTGGKIFIDGQNIARVTQESLWHNISMVPQDPVLFHRTLMENIRYGRPEATDQEVFAAAKAANCHDFIKATPEGYNTYVGERGIKLSGGERQRVAIARAILRNAPVLVLDEATSSLDSESEQLIQGALKRLMKGKTVIVIAHRLSTVKMVDRIVVVDEGGIIEEGSHDELIKKPEGMYNKLWAIQSGGFIE